jgi:hypothetical protein
MTTPSHSSSLTLSSHSLTHAKTEEKDEEAAYSSNDHDDAREQKDPNIVDWEENDPENPRNWSTGYKTWITAQLGLLAFAASLGSSIISPAETKIAVYTGISSEVAVLPISLYM